MLYLQDLAYYDLGPGPASGPGQPQPGGAGVNERVREWMLDVERHAGQDLGGDQRSQHSKANIKTSPRSVFYYHSETIHIITLLMTPEELERQKFESQHF